MAPRDNGTMTSRHTGRARFAGLSLAIALLGGCGALPSVGPDYQTPDTPIPAAWHAATPAAGKPSDLSRWWQQLDDPLLATLIDDALSGSLDLKAARAC